MYVSLILSHLPRMKFYNQIAPSLQENTSDKFHLIHLWNWVDSENNVAGLCNLQSLYVFYEKIMGNDYWVIYYLWYIMHVSNYTMLKFQCNRFSNNICHVCCLQKLSSLLITALYAN